ncbi:KH domain-containing protein [Candidatus Roizmanbacteria bacterium]|nr:KH domain-containing protein [Candidatus Roizmanbacteria bacterium]
MEKQEVVKTEAEGLLSKLINEYTLEVTESNGAFQIVIKTEEAPTIIGRHGETIRAIQKILEVILYKKLQESVHVLINVNDYREKQQERLEYMAGQYADKVTESRQPENVFHLSSYERRIIHQYITTNYPELASYSEGEGRDRKLIIDLKENAPAGATETV